MKIEGKYDSGLLDAIYDLMIAEGEYEGAEDAERMHQVLSETREPEILTDAILSVLSPVQQKALMDRLTQSADS
jgi:hypothetical protein